MLDDRDNINYLISCYLTVLDDRDTVLTVTS